MRLPQPPSALHYPWLKLSFDRVGSSGRLAPKVRHTAASQLDAYSVEKGRLSPGAGADSLT